MESGEKVAMQRIEFADRQTNGIVLAVRPRAHYPPPLSSPGTGTVKVAEVCLQSSSAAATDGHVRRTSFMSVPTMCSYNMSAGQYRCATIRI